MSVFSRNLNALFEDPRGMNPLDAARELKNKLAAARQEVDNLENQLKIVTQRMNGDLALGIRRQNPALNVGVNSDGCKVGYKTKHMIITPDVEKGVWSTKSPDGRFLGKFTKQYSPYTVLNPDIGDLISSVLGHFTGHFKTLGEEITGNGVILVEGKCCTLLELAQWRDSNGGPRRPLNSRLARRHGNCN
jgi:hypothetical protein